MNMKKTNDGNFWFTIDNEEMRALFSDSENSLMHYMLSKKGIELKWSEDGNAFQMNHEIALAFRDIVLAYVKDDISKGNYSNPGTWMDIVQLSSIVRDAIVYERLEDDSLSL